MARLSERYGLFYFFAQTCGACEVMSPIVRSVADRTRAGSRALEDFKGRFRDRMGALARVNGLLSRLHEGDRVTFDELIAAELIGHGLLDGRGGGA